jgi:hypothetical protein
VPVKKVGKGKFKFGKSGKTYKGKGAKAKAKRQGRAIHASKTRKKR